MWRTHYLEFKTVKGLVTAVIQAVGIYLEFKTFSSLLVEHICNTKDFSAFLIY